MKRIKDLPKKERPREKLLEKGAKTLSDQELLAVILGRGTQKNDVLSLLKKIVKLIDSIGLDFQAKAMSIPGKYLPMSSQKEHLR